MCRRKLIGGVGGAVGASATAGCMGLLSCGAGEHEAANIAEEPAAYDEVAVEGTVSDLNEDGFGIVVDDTTGSLRIFPGGGYAYDKEVLDEGDCVEIEGTVDVESTRDSEYDAVIDEDTTTLS
ncbi:hypothetical protein G9C85_18420 [Halorubellus sp. JP-L1]|uniref:OB-fold nucleic acid binding domain-containing protein n=1 Tax=Halorubellus sp. JP-L1 TaxID=2715753 RepID=UPI00140D3B0C|nr:OB-fold nucleic acid binding domain-containing protein [Halorubellus sp. JP-L1]NHN43598.1 hypothetical protein [Halorubellus sp. JP-L1]